MANQTKPARVETAAKILLFDLESSPNIGFTWGKFEQNVIEFIKERQIICFSWEWLDTGEHGTLALPDFPGYKKDPENNKALIAALHRLFSKADIIIGHNLDRFDDRRANTDFIKHGFPPPPPHKTVDTLKVVRKYFDFNGNRLSDLGAFLKVGSKVRHEGFPLWRKCLQGCLRAWAKMRRYNRGDVRLLKRIYLKLRPWIKTHPAIKVREDSNKNPPCPQCDERRLQGRGTSMTRKGRIPRVQCGACGFWPPIAWIKKAWRVK